MRIRPIAFAVALTVIVGGFVAAAPVSAAPAPCPTPGTDSRGLVDHQDIDADPHVRPDPVVGVPRSGSGAIDVRYNDGATHQRIGQSFFAGLPAPGAADRFGTAVAFADLDDDVCADLVIGSPGSNGGRGAVVLAVGSTAGLKASGASRLQGQSAGEHFGTSAAVLGSDVFVGAPDRTVSGRLRAGAVDWYHVTGAGQVSFVQSITQDTQGVPGVAETGDRFGRALAAGGSSRLLIGDPDEAIGSAASAGTVTSIAVTAGALSSAAVFSRNTAGVFGVPEDGDRFGYAVAADDHGAHVGVPGARVGSSDGGGAVYTIVPNVASGWRLSRVFTQNSANVPGAAEPGDHFGAALAAGAFTNCAGLAGRPSDAANLAIGSPDEDAGTLRDIGTVTFVPTSSPMASTLCDRAYYQGSRGGLGGAAEAGDRFGASLARVAAPFDESTFGEVVPPDHLQIGVPGEDVGSVIDAGGVALTTLTGSLNATSYNDSTGPVANQMYGASLGRSSSTIG